MEDKRKLEIGEEVYILTKGKDILNHVLRGKVEEEIFQLENGNNKLYKIVDEIGLSHVLYYPESPVDEYVLKFIDYIEKLWRRDDAEKEYTESQYDDNYGSEIKETRFDYMSPFSDYYNGRKHR